MVRTTGKRTLFTGFNLPKEDDFRPALPALRALGESLNRCCRFSLVAGQSCVVAGKGLECGWDEALDLTVLVFVPGTNDERSKC